MSSNLSISIITPSFNRADELEHLLHSLEKQTYNMEFVESIISDDGSTDGTESLIKEWEKKATFSLKYVKQENQGPGAARNHGLQKSKGDLILFIDSDCEAHPDWIKIIVDDFQNSSFDAFGGPDHGKDNFSSLQKAIDYSMTSFFTTGGMRGHSENMIAKFYPRTHNMGITRNLYRTIGGFGSLRHGQDIEFSNRIHKANSKVRFIKDAIVYHRRRTSLKQFFKQVFNWGVARVNLGKIDSSMLEVIHFLPALALLVGCSSILITFLLGFSTINLIFFYFILLFLLASYGAVNKKSIKVLPYLLIVIPAQIIGYGTGFFQAFIKRYFFNQAESIGFKKNYYK